MPILPMLPSATRLLAASCLALLLAGCGMKGDLRLPDPPPTDAALAAPPTLDPGTTPDVRPDSQS